MRATRSHFNAEINVTPLVDVCLVLLIIFMLVIPTLVTGMPVDLPKAGTAEAVGEGPMHITIKADRTIYLDSAVVRRDELAAALERRQQQRQRPVVVRADKSVAYGDVVEVLDACRGTGFETVGLAAEKK
jgi:biopolymer transport protein ExbD